MKNLVEYLAGLGHRRIAYVNGWSTDTVAGGCGRDPVIETADIVERRESYRLTMQALGLSHEATVYAVPKDDPTQTVANAAAAWRDAQAAPTAIVTCDAGQAAALIREFNGMGGRVPQHVSVAAAGGADDPNQDRVAEAAATADVNAFPANPQERYRMIAFDLTELAKKWVSGEIPNCGVVLRFSGEGCCKFYSSEFQDFPFRPTLVIAYEGAEIKTAP